MTIIVFEIISHVWLEPSLYNVSWSARENWPKTSLPFATCM